ncbi:uncharacterized protein LOC125065906 [Vanessa atalanta]|uniref:uncharacterized protein LOC125065906 n=1 Tax=Vanessa atalanta TaxID=42275 RepID=UPI001FCCF38F|nr:uncharacterized protein LOC125065906 [Vanessa atalanta]
MEPKEKRDEEYPLLKVDAGGGDGKLRNAIPATIMTTGWNITCTPKQSWCTRWPEFVSAFWMTLILLAISFLVFYAIGMSAHRRQPIVIVRCNDTKAKPGSDVFYHHIIARDAYVPFTFYSEYLSFMASQYPSLRYHVYFLIDDSTQPFRESRYPSPRLLKRIVPRVTDPFNTIHNQNKRDIRDFQKRYQNVNISVMNLSKYMAMTPLKFKWVMIPQNYLSFYARVYEIWQNGGIGFDLTTFNNIYKNNKELDQRIDNILKQHNNGFELEKYDDVLESIDNDEQKELFSMFFNLIERILNETRLFFDTDLTTNVTILGNSPLVRTHRNKRDTGNITKAFNVTNSNITSSNNAIYTFNDTVRNISMVQNNVSIEVKFKNGSILNTTNTTVESPTHLHLKTTNISGYRSEIPQVLFFYDISRISDETGPTYFLPKPIQSGEVIKTVTASNQKRSNYLSLSHDGYFVAASSRHHPFLAQLFSSSCHRLNPKYAIKDTLLSQCSGFLRDDIYCENIRLLYNII